MSFSRKLLIGVIVVLIVLAGIGAWLWHGSPSDQPISITEGLNPTLGEQAPERFPSVGLAKPIGWKAGEAPVAAAGLKVERFAQGLDHPRTLLTLPNGDVLVAETNAPAAGGSGGITGFVAKQLMHHVGADVPSPNTIVLLRDGNGDGTAEQRFTFRTGLDSPSGMAYGNGKLYIAQHNAVLAFDFTPGATALAGTPRKIADLAPGGQHWMRNLLLSPDGSKLYVAVGSSSNIGDNGMEAENRRAAILEIDVATGHLRQFAGGMRNPNGMGWNPSTGELWAVVQERDMIGPDLVPDYLTNVPIGAQYGWPWIYWKSNMDDRVNAPMPEFMMDYTRKPEYAMGAHTAVLGMVFAGGGNVMGQGFANGAFVARHGSWNRKPLSGYDVVFVAFDANGNPVGKPRPVLSGFLAADGSGAHGRPVWLAWDKAGALLVSDDTAGVIWRVWAPGAAPSVPPRPVVTAHMPPQRALNGDPDMDKFESKWKTDGPPAEATK
jgi:glucose/arabinose dehydrogenase